MRCPPRRLVRCDSLLVATDLTKSDGTGTVTVGLLDTTGSGGGGGLAGGLGSDCWCKVSCGSAGRYGREETGKMRGRGQRGGKEGDGNGRREDNDGTAWKRARCRVRCGQTRKEGEMVRASDVDNRERCSGSGDDNRVSVRSVGRVKNATHAACGAPYHRWTCGRSAVGALETIRAMLGRGHAREEGARCSEGGWLCIAVVGSASGERGRKVEKEGVWWWRKAPVCMHDGACLVATDACMMASAYAWVDDWWCGGGCTR